MTRLLALVKKELLILFGSPRTYLVLALFALSSSLIFFDHIRVYNQLLFLYTTTTLGGFDIGTLPDSITVRHSVFLPMMDSLGLVLVGIVPLVTMQALAEERSRGTDQLLLVSGLSPRHIVAAKFVVYAGLALLAITIAFIYPTAALGVTDVGLRQMISAYLGLVLHVIGLVSIGLVASAFARNQLLAAVGAWAIGFTLWDLSWMEEVLPAGAVYAKAISLQPRFSAFSDGIIAIGDLAFFAVLISLSVALTRFSFDLRRATG